MLHINMKSTSLVHTPGIMRYLQFLHNSGQPEDALRIYRSAFPVLDEDHPDLTRSLLSDELMTTFQVNDDLHVLFAFDNDHQERFARKLADFYRLPANYRHVLYVGDDYGILCEKCVDENLDEILDDISNITEQFRFGQWIPQGFDATLNLDLDDVCDHCWAHVHPDHEEV